MLNDVTVEYVFTYVYIYMYTLYNLILYESSKDFNERTVEVPQFVKEAMKDFIDRGGDGCWDLLAYMKCMIYRGYSFFLI